MASVKIPEQKVILCGEFGVGKSSLFRRFMSDSFTTATDRLEGKYFVYQRTDLKVRRYGKTKCGSKLSKEELESLMRMTSLNARIPMIFFLDGKKEFNIVERFKSGKRGWDLHDLDGHSKEIRLSSRLGCVKAGNSIYRGDWIKEGNLVMTTTHLDW